jgi:hypothetical protein
MIMRALLYLFFLAGLGLLLFCVDLARWHMPRYQLALVPVRRGTDVPTM